MDPDTQTPPPPPAPDPDTGPAGGGQPSAFGLVRPRDDRLVSGVSSGVAHYFGVDTAWVRLVFALATVFWFTGVVVYIVLAIVMPQVDHLPEDRPGPRSPTEFWLGTGILLALVLTGSDRLPRPGWLVPVVLVAVGVALWQRPRTDRSAAQSEGTSPGPRGGSGDAGAAVASGVRSMADRVTALGAQVGTIADSAGTEAPPVPGGRGGQSSPPVWWQPPPPRRRPSWLGPATLGIAMLVAVVLMALSGLGAVQVTATHVLATCLVILGVGMLVGTVWGHAKWLAVPSLLLVAALMVVQTATFVGIDLTANVVPGTYVVGAHADAATSSGLGQVTVDLAGDEWDRGPQVVELGAGQLRVVVPWDADVALTAEVGAGQVRYEVTDGFLHGFSSPRMFDSDTLDSDTLDSGATASGDTMVVQLGGGLTLDVLVEDDAWVIEGRDGPWFGEDVGRGIPVSVDRTLVTPWVDDADVLELDATLGAGQLVIARQVPPDDVLERLLQEEE